ncbi:MAG: transposase [Actinomycetota bacterium]|nr:transposase [Actinomycetota bacterium]
MLQLVMFFEDLRSERQLMRVVADRLSLRWYVGYDLHEPLPDHPPSPGSGSVTVSGSSGASSTGSWRCA